VLVVDVAVMSVAAKGRYIVIETQTQTCAGASNPPTWMGDQPHI